MNYQIEKFPFNPRLFISLSILTKFVFVRSILFQDNIIHSFLVETPPLLIILLTGYILWHKKKSIRFYLLTDLILTVFLMVMLLYYEEFGKIITHENLSQVNMLPQITGSIFSLIQPYYLLIFSDFLILYLSRRAKRYRVYIRPGTSTVFSTKTLTGIIAFCILLMGFTITVNKQTMINLTRFAKQAGMVNAEFTGVLLSMKPKEQAPISSFSLDDLNSPDGLSYTLMPHFFGTANGDNLIVMQLEAIQTFLINLKINHQEVTPNLNRFLSETQYFPNFFSQIGDGHTSDAEFIVNTSIYALPSKPITTVYQNRAFPGLPKLLKAYQYNSYTFHTNKVTYWNRDDLYPALGYDKYFDQAFFGREDILGMGPSDEVLYGKTLSVLMDLTKKSRPFYANLVTISSHHPFQLPEDRVDLKLPPEFEGTYVGNYLKAAHYADAALGKFLTNLKQSGILDHSLLVLYGDHYGIPFTVKGKDADLMHTLLGREYDTIDKLNVPLMIRIPGVKGEVRPITGGDVDILPTIANLLGIDLKNQIRFGKDLLNIKDNLIGIRCYLPEGSFMNNRLLYFSDTQTAQSLDTHQNVSLTAEDLQDATKIKNILALSDQYLDSLPAR